MAGVKMGIVNGASVIGSLFNIVPSYLVFQITSKCNSRCLTCFNWKSLEDESQKDLTIDEIKKISENYGRVLQLTIGGGEPFLRNDLSDICQIFCRVNHAKHITIPTNCLQPAKIENTVRDILEKCNLNYLKIGLSLDGVENDHDLIRGVQGNYEKLVETYNRLVRLRIKYPKLGIHISSVLSTFNRDSICSTIDTVKSDFPDIDHHAVVLVRGDTRDNSSKEVSVECYKETLDYLKQVNTRKPQNFIVLLFRSLFDMTMEIVSNQMKTGQLSVDCLAGQRLLVITHNGTVYPCELLSQSFGNLRDSDYNIKPLIKSRKAYDIKQFIKKKQCSCTWECAIHASIVFNIRYYPTILRRTLFNK